MIPGSIHSDVQELAQLLKPSWSAMSAEIAASGVPTCEVAAPEAKEKLKKIEAAIEETRDERAEKVSVRDQARDAYAKTESLSEDSDEYKAVKAAVAELGEVDDKIASLQSQQVTMLQSLGRNDDIAKLSGGHNRPAGDPSDPRAAGAWNSAAVMEDQEIQATLRHMSGSKAKIGPVQLGEVANRDALMADVTGSANMRRGDYYGILPQLRRMLRVLDLLDTGTMDGNSIPYTEESGSLDTAAETAEGQTKPEGAWTPTDKTAEAQTIAHFQKLRKQVLSDFPALQTIIDGRLRYGVERRLEGQVLSGDGSGSNLRGITKTSGIGNVAFDAGELASDQVLSGIMSVLLADAMADGIVMNPIDWAAVMKQKATGGDEQYYGGGPFGNTPQIMWGIPLVPSKAIPQGTALVGDFGIGATLFIREGVSVLLSDSDQDDFVKNKVTMLAEMRGALPVWRPPAFCVVELTDPTP